MLRLCDVLEMDLLTDAKMLTTTHDPNHAVTGVSIMEAPDIVEWVESNEIILTNLYSVHQDSDTMDAFVNSLGDKELCALIVKTGRYFSEVPIEIYNAAQRHRIALVEIPAHVRFTELIYQIMAAVFDSQVTQLSYFKQTRDLFTGLALKNAGVSGIARTFTQMVKNPVIIFDEEMSILFSTEPGDWVLDGVGSSESMEQGDFRYSILTVADASGSYRASSMPIQVRDMVVGHLTVVEKYGPMQELRLIAMQNAAAVLSLEMLKDLAVSEVERDFRLDLIDDILQGKDISSIEERGRSIGWHFENQYTPVVVNFSLEKEASAGSYGGVAVDTRAKSINNIIHGLMDSHTLQGVAESKKHKAVILIKQPYPDPKRSEAKLEAFFRDLHERLCARYPSLRPVRIGCVSLFGELSSLPELYRNAQHALKISTILDMDICDFEQLGVFKLLSLAKRQEELERFVPQALHRLMEYDEENQSNLLGTLESYFTNGRNSTKAAAALFIHYKTITYRMNKIQEITGIDLKNQKQLLELEIGLQIHKVLDLAGDST